MTAAQGLCLDIDADGMPVYGQRWAYAGDFRDGVAVVQADDGRPSHIDRGGLLVHLCWFPDLDVFTKAMRAPGGRISTG
jgi:hypothetical protein